MSAQALINLSNEMKEVDPNMDVQKAIGEVVCDMDKAAEASEATEEFTSEFSCKYILDPGSEYAGEFDDSDGAEEASIVTRTQGKRRRSKGFDWIIHQGPDPSGNWSERAEDGTAYPYEEVHHELVPRKGPVRPYVVNARKNDDTLTAKTFKVHSSSYPNGNDGDTLIAANNDNSRYLVVTNGCGPSDYQLISAATKGQAAGQWVTEHILELQAFPRFLETAISGKYKLPRSFTRPTLVAFEPVNQSDFSMIYPYILSEQFPGWHEAVSPAELAMAMMGSDIIPNTMVVCESTLNAIKSFVSLRHAEKKDVGAQKTLTSSARSFGLSTPWL